MVISKKYVINFLPEQVYLYLYSYFSKKHFNKRLFIDTHLRRYYLEEMYKLLPDYFIETFGNSKQSDKPLTFYVHQDFLPIIQKQAKFNFRSETDEMRRFCIYIYYYLTQEKNKNDKTLL